MKVLVPLADGFEEMEAATTINILKRGGLDVVVAGLPGTIVRGSRGLKVMLEKKLDDLDINDFDALVLVGGYPGYKNLSQSNNILRAVVEFDEKKKLIAAICGAPSVLAKTGILDDRRATIYPGLEKEIPRPREGRVVIDEHIITSQGPGTAIDFALAVLERLAGREVMERVKKEIVY
ncbi:MAG: DJ-1 family protein [Candidatus Aenigmatarchaeota archaeon]|nr:MAG: DJ-1 family protein [Candidatus Aenigmarchaeota archaeon]RLJ08047.1 MAG: DJ-1 family protein [Candidatus Aenigmarchaeota archaeon]